MNLVKRSRLLSGAVPRVVSVAMLLGVWYAAAWLPAKPLLPPPHQVLLYLVQDVQKPEIWKHLGATLMRILLGFALSMAIAVPFGIALGFSAVVRNLLGSWVVIGLMIPSLVFIILAYTSIGLNEFAAVVAAALAVVWVLTINIWESAKAVDVKLIQMARGFGLAPVRIITSVVLPQLASSLMASVRFGLGLIWKMVLFVELLGRSNGIGYQIEYYHQLFDLGRVLEYTVFFVAIMLLIEVVVLGGVERRLFRWRPAARLA